MPDLNGRPTPNELLAEIQRKAYGEKLFSDPTAQQPKIETSRQIAADPTPQEKQQPLPPDPEVQRLQERAQHQKELAAAMQPSLDSQVAGAKDIEDEIAKLKAQPKKLNLAPLLAWADSFGGGSNLSGSYKAPPSEEERAKTIIGLKQALQKSRGEITADQVKQLQAIGYGKNDASDARAMFMKARLDNSQMTAAGKLPGLFNNDPVLKNADSQVASLDKGLGLIAKIKDPNIPLKERLVFSARLKSELETDYANALQGTKGVTEGSVHRTELETSAAKLNRLKSLISNKEEDLNSPEYLQQLENGFTSLQDEIGGISQKRAASLLDQYGAAHVNNKYAPTVLDKIKEQRIKKPVQREASASPASTSGGSPFAGLQSFDQFLKR